MSSSSVTPRPRPGYQSPPARLDVSTMISFFAAVLRAIFGVVFVFMATLALPVHPITPILTGAGILMVVNGAYASWQWSRRDERLTVAARVIVWGAPLCLLVVVILLAVLGPSSVGPFSNRAAQAAYDRQNDAERNR